VLSWTSKRSGGVEAWPEHPEEDGANHGEQV